jgi:hypothetical protein
MIASISGGGGGDGTSGATRDSCDAGSPIQKSSCNGLRLVAEERAEALAADAAHELAREMAIRDGVVPVLCARLPHGRLRGERFDHRRPREDLVDRERAVDHRETGAVRHEHAHGDLTLSLRGELGPVVGNLCVVVDLAPLREQRDAHRRGAFRGREDELECAVVVGPTRRRVGDAAPEVDHLLSVDVHGDARPELAVLGEVADERVAHGFEAGLDRAADGGSSDVGHAASTISRS